MQFLENFDLDQMNIVFTTDLTFFLQEMQAQTQNDDENCRKRGV